MSDVITTVGRAQIAGYASGVVASLTTYYGAVGTGAGTAAVADTTLFTESGATRVSITPTRVTVTLTNDTAQYAFTFTATGAISVTNSGYFTALTVGTLMQKSDHATIPLLLNDSIAYTFQDKMS